MTHDELMAKIEASDDNLNFYAIRAVVELHKPYNDEGFLMCSYCDWNSYPCGTIEAIEKELG